MITQNEEGLGEDAEDSVHVEAKKNPAHGRHYGRQLPTELNTDATVFGTNENRHRRQKNTEPVERGFPPVLPDRYNGHQLLKSVSQLGRHPAPVSLHRLCAPTYTSQQPRCPEGTINPRKNPVDRQLEQRLGSSASRR